MMIGALFLLPLSFVLLLISLLLAGWADFVLASSFVWFSSCSPRDFKEGVLEAFPDQVIPSYWVRIQEYVY